jgi:ADP-ribose pyrophosphatase YjhB (NUDIX family)
MRKYSGVIVKCGDEVLLCRRNQNTVGEWSIPSGKLDKKIINDGTEKIIRFEDYIDCAKREFFEETNVNIDNEDLSFVSITERRNRDGKQIKGFLYMYLLETDNRIFPDFINAKDGDEHDNFGYFSVDNLPLNISPQLENVVKLILKKDCRCQF